MRHPKAIMLAAMCTQILNKQRRGQPITRRTMWACEHKDCMCKWARLVLAGALRTILKGGKTQ